MRELINFIVANKELIKVFYGLAVTLICIVIVFKTDKLFRLSSHQGIRYFRNAFFFFGIAFVIRYFGTPFLRQLRMYTFWTSSKFLFEFFIIMAGFFLLYSLLWKKVENQDKFLSSLFNKHIVVLYFMSATIALIDYLWKFYYLMFLSQIIIFLFASTISFLNYQRKGGRHKFLKFYFIAMFLSLTAWVLNAVTAAFLGWSSIALILINSLNVIIFLLFLFGVMVVTKNRG